MSTQIQRRRDPKADNEAFTGAEGEFVYETDTHRAVTHDGARQGGYPIPHFEDVQNQSFTFADAAGTATAITCSTDVDPDALVAGMKITLKMGSAATGASTLAWGTLTATNIKLLSAGVKSDPIADTWSASDYVDFIFDGVDFIAIAAGGGGGGLVDYQVFTASGTWTKPAGANKVKVTCVGGGGGGGSYTASGGGGGQSSFGSHCSANGGGGGGGVSYLQYASATPGGAGNTTGVGDGVFGGADGANGIGVVHSNRTVATSVGGKGGDSLFGGGGRGGSSHNGADDHGEAGNGYGGGGGGSAYTNGPTAPITGGGGAGGTTAVKFIETGIGATETVTIGAGGSGANQAFDGGAGASGVVIVESYK